MHKAHATGAGLWPTSQNGLSPHFVHALCVAGEVDIETCAPETRTQIGSCSMLSTKDLAEGTAVPQLDCTRTCDHFLMQTCLNRV